MSWAQSVENAAKLFNLDTLSIVLSKLLGPPLKLACFLESKEVNVGKQLSWQSLKKHLTNNYSKIPYVTHAINAYDNLHKAVMSLPVYTYIECRTSLNVYTTQQIW